MVQATRSTLPRDRFCVCLWRAPSVNGVAPRQHGGTPQARVRLRSPTPAAEGAGGGRCCHCPDPDPGRAGQGRAGQGRAGWGRGGGGAGQGGAGQGRAGQGRAGQGRAGQGGTGQGARWVGPRRGVGRGRGGGGVGRGGMQVSHAFAPAPPPHMRCSSPALPPRPKGKTGKNHLWLFEAPVRNMILQMHTPARSSHCWSRQTPAWTRSVHQDTPGQRHGQQPRLWDGRPPE